MANANAHLANGIAKSEAILKLFLRYDAQLHRHYRNCLKDLRDLQAERLTPIEPNPAPPSAETPTPNEPIQAAPTTVTTPTPIEPNLTPEQARTQYMKSEIQRFEEYQARLFKPHNEPRP